ncbi:MAG: DNA binding protein [Cirrosporium novae-zelandiae]|nr:MAG: DNA binding protein [Cirrosporium novae-zelandiae]
MAGTQVMQLRPTAVVPQKETLSKEENSTMKQALTYQAQSTPQEVHQKQSLEIVKTMIHGSDFLAGRLSKGNRKGGDDQPNKEYSGFAMKVLGRGRNKKVDQLLDYLENGVFDALKKRVLSTLQLAIFTDKEDPSKVIESYTFTFQYTGNVHDPNRRLTGIGLQGPKGKPVLLPDVKFEVERVVRLLCVLTQMLPRLPDKCYVNMYLFYTDDCPRDYEPPLFKQFEDDIMFLGEAPGWTRSTETCGQIDTGFHSVSVKMDCLQNTKPSSNTLENDYQIPDNLTYEKQVSRPQKAEPSMIQSIMSVVDSSEPAQQSEERTAISGPTEQNSGVPNPEHRNGTAMPLSESTQQVEDRLTSERLQKMMPSKLSTQDSGLTPTQSIGSFSAHASEALQISQATYANAQRKRKEQTDTTTAVATDAGDQIHCECGSNVTAAQLGNILTATAIIARTTLDCLNHISVIDFSESLGCSNQTAAIVRKRLKTEGYLMDTPGSHDKNFNSKNLPKFRAINTPAQVEKRNRNYFDPLLKVAHHFDNLHPTLPQQESTFAPIAPPDSAAATISVATTSIAQGDERRVTESVATYEQTDELVDLMSPPSRKGSSKLSLVKTRRIGLQRSSPIDEVIVHLAHDRSAMSEELGEAMRSRSSSVIKDNAELSQSRRELRRTPMRSKRQREIDEDLHTSKKLKASDARKAISVEGSDDE